MPVLQFIIAEPGLKVYSKHICRQERHIPHRPTPSCNMLQLCKKRPINVQTTRLVSAGHSSRNGLYSQDNAKFSAKVSLFSLLDLILVKGIIKKCLSEGIGYYQLLLMLDARVLRCPCPCMKQRLSDLLQLHKKTALGNRTYISSHPSNCN